MIDGRNLFDQTTRNKKSHMKILEDLLLVK